MKVLVKTDPDNIPRLWKSTLAAASLSKRSLVLSISPRGWFLLDRRQGFLTAIMCFDSVIEEHRPFGAPKFRMCSQ